MITRTSVRDSREALGPLFGHVVVLSDIRARADYLFHPARLARTFLIYRSTRGGNAKCDGTGALKNNLLNFNKYLSRIILAKYLLNANTYIYSVQEPLISFKYIVFLHLINSYLLCECFVSII